MAWIFRFVLTHSAQNDKGVPFLQVDFFAVATPCNPLGRYAQNDKNELSS